MPVRARRAIAPLLAVVWLSVVGLGMQRLWAYTFTPGTAARALVMWPGSSSVTRDGVRPTLLMFAHPHCPCSRASVGELARLMTFARGRLDARVVVVKAAGTPRGWEHADIWDLASAIPGVDVVADQDGGEARRFGAVVSGQTFLYDTTGRLLFAGGLTLGRGHAGDNAGTDAVRSWLDHGLGTARSPVFGCALQ